MPTLSLALSWQGQASVASAARRLGAPAGGCAADMRLAPPHWLSGIVGSVSGGALLDLFGGSMRSGLLIAAIAMATCAAFILVALLAKRAHDYREDETQQQQAAQQHLEPHEASADVERSPRQQQQQLEQQQHQQHTDELQPLTKADGLGAASGKDV